MLHLDLDLAIEVNEMLHRCQINTKEERTKFASMNRIQRSYFNTLIKKLTLYANYIKNIAKEKMIITHNIDA